MGLRDDLQSGLRAAAGTLSPSIYQEQQQVDTQKKAAIAQEVLKGIGDGRVPPEQGAQVLAKLGYEMPANVLGPSAETQKRQQDMANQTAMAGAVKGAMGENGEIDLGKAASAMAAIPGGTQNALALLEKKQAKDAAITERQDAREQRAQEFKLKLAQDLQIARERNASAQELRQMMLNGQKELRMIMGANKADKPLTEVQGNATAFAMRAADSLDRWKELEDKGFTGPSLKDRAADFNLPFTDVKPANALMSDEAQQFNAAKLNFVTAVLRKESGAAISPSEFKTEDKKYFPQIGDSQAVLKQKKEARELALETLKVQAGPGAKNVKRKGSVIVNTPNGSYNFPDQASADAFKQEAGIE